MFIFVGEPGKALPFLANVVAEFDVGGRPWLRIAESREVLGILPAQAQSVFPAGTDSSVSPLGDVQVCIDDRVVLTKGDGATQTTFVPATGAVRLEGIFDTTTYHYPVFITNYRENNTLQTQMVFRDAYQLPVRKAQADYENDPGQGTGV